MAAGDPNTARTDESFSRLQSLTDILGVSFGGLNKSVLTQQHEFNRLVRSIQNDNNDFTESGKKRAIEMAKALKEDQERFKKEEELSQKREAAAKKLVSDLTGMAKQSIGAGQSIYASDQAFTSVIPTLELMGTVVKAATSAIAGLAAGIPIFSGLSEAANKAIGVATDVTIQVAQQQLQNAQKYVETYNALSKVGVTFGGDIEKMRLSAKNGGLSLDQYSKFVTSNIDGLSKMGGTLEQAADRIMHMSKSALANDKSLLALYGSYSDVDEGLEMYASTMVGYGMSMKDIQTKLSETGSDYLRSLKDIQAITGKNAKTLKAEEDARSRNAAYQMKLSSMGVEAATRTTEQMRIYSSMYGASAAKFMEEYIANNGKIISAENLRYMNSHAEVAKVGIKLVEAASIESREARLKADADIITSAESGITANHKRNESLYELTANEKVASNAVIAQNAKAAAEEMALSDKRVNFLDGINKLLEDEKTRLENAKKGDKTAADGLADVIESQNNYKIAMDDMTAKSLPRMEELTKKLIGIQAHINSTFGTESALDKAVTSFSKALDYLAEKMNGDEAPKAPILNKQEQKTAKDLLAQPTTAEGTISERDQAWLKKQLENKTGPAIATPLQNRLRNQPTTRGPAEPKAPAQNTPAQNTPAQNTPAQNTPAQNTPTQNTPTVGSLGQRLPKNRVSPLPPAIPEYEPTATEKLLDNLNQSNLKNLSFAGGKTGTTDRFERLSDKVKKSFLSMVQEFGQPVTVNSSVRTEEDQERLYNAWIAAGGDYATNPTVMAPGIGKITTPTRPGTRDSHINQLALDIDKTSYAALQKQGFLDSYGFRTVNKDPGHIQMMNKGGNLNKGESAVVGDGGPELIEGPAKVNSVYDTASMPALLKKIHTTLETLVTVTQTGNNTQHKMLQAVR